MGACLIVENGTNVTGSNSYLTAEDAEIMLNGIGETFGNTPKGVIETHLLKAMRWLESFRSKFQGSKETADQSLQWPREDVMIDGFPLPSGIIPYELKMAQALGALTEINGTPLQRSNDGRTVIQETIAGAISVTYADNGVSGNSTSFPDIETYLDVLLIHPSRSMQVYRS